jgi:hypothetical protein
MGLNPDFAGSNLLDKIDHQHLLTYTLLFLLENGLRELIIEELHTRLGPRWYRQRLSKDLLAKFEDGTVYDRSTRWTEMVPHHPLYYLDFPDLKKILLRNDNWNDAFKPIFMSQEMLTGTLSEIEPIRNKVAHHRLVSAKDTSITLAAYSKIAEAVGSTRWERLLQTHTYARDIKMRLNELGQHLRDLYAQCIEAHTLPPDMPWKHAFDAWWFDSEYLGSSIKNIEHFLSTIQNYIQLTRFRGDGYKIEKWLSENDFHNLYNRSISELTVLLK